MIRLAYSYAVSLSDAVVATTTALAVPGGNIVVPKSVRGHPFANGDLDLIRVAAAVLSADRLSPRRHGRMPRWKRHIGLAVEVHDPSRWTQAAPTLAELLSFMTDDTWDVSFEAGRRQSVQCKLPIPGAGPQPDEVALFSGGLDSAAGLFARSRETGGRILAVSAYGNLVRKRNQEVALEAIVNLGVSAQWAPLEYALSNARRKPSQKEGSQRSRALLFLAMGAATAATFGFPKFHIYETGIGCLNPPFTKAQVGAQATKATHPRTLVLFNTLVRTVLDRPAQAVTPFFFMTKGELCRSVGSQLPNLVCVASSCDEGDGHKEDPMEHCGLCTSCLFRRIALHAAECDDPTSYRDRQTRAHGIYEVSLFENLLYELSSRRSFDALLDLDPDIRFATNVPTEHALTPGTVKRDIEALFARYASELSSFLRHQRPSIGAPTRGSRHEARRQYDLFSATR